MASGKRVMFIAPSAYPLGGVAVWLDYLAAGLPAHGWEPIVGLVAGKWHDVAAYKAAYPQLPVATISNPTGSAEGRIRTLMRAIDHARPDIVAGVNIVDLYTASQRMRSRGYRVHTVMTLHGIAADLLGDLKREAGWLDAVIATNRLTCRLCEDYSGMPRGRIFYAPYGVDVQRLGALPSQLLTNVLNIAWVGRLEQEQKRIDSILPVLAELDRLGVLYKLRIAGDGPDRSSLLARLAPWIDSGRVEYQWVIPAGEVGRRIYAQSDVFLLTSSWETGPIVIWEASAAGLAVVSSRYIGSGLEGALRHEENCLLFPVDDTKAAAGQLARLRDADYRKELTDAGRHLVSEMYSIDKSVTAWAGCFDSIVRLPLRQINGGRILPAKAGRLDDVLGVGLAESLRKAAGIHFEHAEAGGEWPHTSHAVLDQSKFWQMTARADRREDAGHDVGQ